MKVVEHDGSVELTEYNDFSVKQTLECGQCFRFDEIESDKYEIVAYGKKILIEDFGSKIVLSPCTISEFNEIWFHYFDLGTDYSEIKKVLRADDEVMNTAIDFGEGIRILNQEPFECLISFIISQNNRIPMIKKVVKNIAENYGDESFGTYAFPTAERLRDVSQEDFMLCKTGFRGKYIVDAVEKVYNKELILENYKDLSSDELKNELMKVNGIGPKISDCVMLFSCEKKNVFPTDVWIKRIMEYCYFNGEKKDIAEISQFAQEKFGEYAGIAQQYLFYYARENKIGV